MQNTLPQELTATLLKAVPIIHRFLRRLGSFPYQNDPEELLTQRVILEVFYILGASVSYTNTGEFSSYRARLCFQSLASLVPKERNKSLRDEADDEDLIDVLSGMRGKRRHPDLPKIMIRGPEQHPPSHFPSSWSSDMDQLIPVNEFQPLLYLMVVLNLYDIGLGAEDFTTYIPQVEKVTDCLLAAFQAGPNGISWDEFNKVLTDEMVSNPKHILPCSMLTVGALLVLRLVSGSKSPALSHIFASGLSFLGK